MRCTLTSVRSDYQPGEAIVHRRYHQASFWSCVLFLDYRPTYETAHRRHNKITASEGIVLQLMFSFNTWS